MKIFVSIASYRDKLLWQTVESAISNSKYPSSLHFAVVDQSESEYQLKSNQVTYIHIDPKFSRGPCWARSLALSYYDNEDFVLQVDSHTVFDEDWDKKLIDQLLHCSTLSNKCLLSAYPFAFNMVNDKINKFSQLGIINVLRAKVSGPISDKNPNFQFEGHSIKSSIPIKGFHVAGGFIFAPGNFFLEIPYDPCLYFLGEEQNLAIRAFTHGWDIYHPPEVPLYHLYYNKRNRPLHWDVEEDAERYIKWTTLNKKSEQRMCDLIYNGKNLGVYGLGKVRTLKDFAEFSGIDYVNKFITEKYPR